jgi:carboxymethylenebutenolidase
MTMNQKIVSMHAAYRSGKERVDGLLARPFVNRSMPALVLLHGYRGVDDAHKFITRKFATAGFVVLAPELFGEESSQDPVVNAYRKTSLNIEKAVKKIDDSVAYLRSLPFVGKKKIALAGFCMGGGLALYGLARSRKFAAGVIFYQSLFPDPAELKGIQVPLQCHYGALDKNISLAEIDGFQADLTRYKKKFEIHIYQGAGHAFLNNPTLPGTVNRKAADQAFSKSCKWLKKALG